MMGHSLLNDYTFPIPLPPTPHREIHTKNEASLWQHLLSISNPRPLGQRNTMAWLLSWNGKGKKTLSSENKVQYFILFFFSCREKQILPPIETHTYIYNMKIEKYLYNYISNIHCWMNACGKRRFSLEKQQLLLEGPVSSSSLLLLLLNHIPNPRKEHVYKIAKVEVSNGNWFYMLSGVFLKPWNHLRKNKKSI